MPNWLLRVAGVNFSTTMDDTQDLSTRRGASLTLLNAGYAVERRLQRTFGADNIERIFVGASEALFRLAPTVSPGDALDEARRYLRAAVGHPLNRPLYPTAQKVRVPPVATMTFVADIVEDGRPDASDLLVAKVKRAQFQSPTLRPHARIRSAKVGPCPIEHRLPADRGISVRGDMHDQALPLADYRPRRDEKIIAVSRSVAQRRAYGRSARQRFYEHELKTSADLHYADGFVDLVKCPPDAVPQPLKNKVAVITADGIGFGGLLEKAVRQKAGDPIAGLKTFSKDVETMLRDDLLRPLIDALVRCHALDEDGEKRTVSIPAAHADNPEARRWGWSPILRFETLTYAGEDIVWLCPSWLAWDVVRFLFKAAEGARVSAEAPQFRVGVVVCSYKMPIRKARDLAAELAYKVDDGSRQAGCQIELVESIDVSDRYLDAHRARLASDVPKSRFTLKAAKFGVVTEHLGKLRHPRGLPPSQLHRLLRRAATERAFTEEAGRAAVEKDLTETLNRGGYDYGGKKLEFEDLGLAALGAARDPLFGLLRAAQLWDIVEPLGKPIITHGTP